MEASWSGCLLGAVLYGVSGVPASLSCHDGGRGAMTVGAAPMCAESERPLDDMPLPCAGLMGLQSGVAGARLGL